MVAALEPYLIVIAGPSGAGKSALADRLTQLLDSPSTVIALDSYYHSQPDLSLDQRAACNYDHPESLDWQLLESHLQALLAGRAVEAPVYMFDQHTRADATLLIEPHPYLILEGILALHRPSVRSLAALKTFVTTSRAECFRRRLERDIAERGRSRDSIVEQYNSTVLPMELTYVLPTEQFADLVVSGEAALESSALTVLKHVARRSPPTAGDVPDR